MIDTKKKVSKKKRGYLFEFFFWILLIGLAIFLFGDTFSNHITSYPIIKKENFTMALNRTIYEVNKKEQTIIYWMPGLEIPPEKLVDCVVRDKKNWIGYFPDRSGHIEMRKGKIVSNENDTIYVGKLHWWLLTWGVVKK